jgi:hypothetical protein
MHDNANDNKSSKRKEKDGKEERNKGVNAVIWVQEPTYAYGHKFSFCMTRMCCGHKVSFCMICMILHDFA